MTNAVWEKHIAGAFLVLALCGCGGPQLFEAAGHATGVSPQGLSAAEYDLFGPYGTTGSARVWSTGAYDGKVDGAPATILIVVFDLENTGPTSLALTDIALDSDVDGLRLRNVPPARVDGSTIVPPGGDSRVRAYFALSRHIDPRDLGGFRVGWHVQQGEQAYTERTPFLSAPRYGYGPWPYYAPVIYPGVVGLPVAGRASAAARVVRVA